MGSIERKVKVQQSTIQCTALCEVLVKQVLGGFKVGTCMWSNDQRARTEFDKGPGLESDRLVNIPNASFPIGFLGMRHASKLR